MTELLSTGFYKLVRGRHGLFLANPNDIYFGRALVEYGEAGELEWALLERSTPADGFVIDAGANMGTLTVPLANKVGAKGLVYAFEPQPLIFQQLCANLALNDLVNVVAVNAACGSETGRMGIARLNPARESNFGGVPLERVSIDEKAVSVRIERLDDVVDPPRLNLIKADVEGMELALLQGAAGLIGQFRPVLYLECHPSGSESLISHVMGLGYDCWFHCPPLFNPENFAGKAENIYGRTASFNMLCIPAEHEADIRGMHRVAGPKDSPQRRASD